MTRSSPVYEPLIPNPSWLLSLDDYKKTAHVRRELFKGPPWPAATGVVVQGLVRPDALIEIKAVAVLGDPAGPPSAGGGMR